MIWTFRTFWCNKKTWGNAEDFFIMYVLYCVFRCDSISKQLPLSVSGSVIDSFRFGDSYSISELCELFHNERFPTLEFWLWKFHNIKDSFMIAVFENLSRQNKLHIQSLNSGLYICAPPGILSFKKLSSFNIFYFSDFWEHWYKKPISKT